MEPWDKSNMSDEQSECTSCSKTIDELLEAETVRCVACSSIIWDKGFALKKVKNAQGIEQYVQLPVIFCKICGTPLNGAEPEELIKQ